jgi:hypothetical protein
MHILVSPNARVAVFVVIVVLAADCLLKGKIMPAPTAEEILHVQAIGELEEIERAIMQLREGELTTERVKQTLLEVARHYLYASRALDAAKSAKGHAA